MNLSTLNNDFNLYKRALGVLVSLFASVLLVACGGGGSSSGTSLASPPEVGDIYQIESAVAGVNNVTHDTFYLSEKEMFDEFAMPIRTVTITEISGIALNHHFADINAQADIQTNGEEYLIFVPGGGNGIRYQITEGGFAAYDSWWVIRNSNDGSSAPTFIHYTIDHDVNIDSVQVSVLSTEHYGQRLMTTGENITLELSESEILFTATVAADGFITPNSTIAFSDEFDYHVFTHPDYCSEVTSFVDDYCTQEDRTTYAHFIQAEYAALYFFHSVDKPNEANARIRSYGALTPRENLPVSGNISYALNALGGYLDHDDHSNDKVLYGTGLLSADFSSSGNGITLDLDINDHLGNNFLTIDGQELYLQDSYNFFANWDCAGGTSCNSGTWNYANSSLEAGLLTDDHIAVKGSFYGPNGEEVAGTVYHYVDSSGDIVRIGFIGTEE